jgi:hypothetical protein
VRKKRDRNGIETTKLQSSFCLACLLVWCCSCCCDRVIPWSPGWMCRVQADEDEVFRAGSHNPVTLYLLSILICFDLICCCSQCHKLCTTFLFPKKGVPYDGSDERLTTNAANFILPIYAQRHSYLPTCHFPADIVSVLSPQFLPASSIDCP